MSVPKHLPSPRHTQGVAGVALITGGWSSVVAFSPPIDKKGPYQTTRTNTRDKSQFLTPDTMLCICWLGTAGAAWRRGEVCHREQRMNISRAPFFGELRGLSSTHSGVKFGALSVCSAVINVDTHRWER